MRSAGVTFSAASEPPDPLAGPVSFESATTDPIRTLLSLHLVPAVVGSGDGSSGAVHTSHQVYIVKFHD